MSSSHSTKPSSPPAIAAVFALAVCAPGCSNDMTRTQASNAPRPESLKVHVVDRYPHARDAFTQGLIWHDGTMYESTGGHGDSSLRLVDLASGNVQRQADLEARYFGEGIALVGERIIQLTWQAQKAFVYDARDFKRIAEFSYQGEGWGLCYDGTRLIMSDGTARLQFRDPETFALLGQVSVTINGRPQARLNELECVGKAVYANVWQYDEIVRIDPETGYVTAIIDASGLLDKAQQRGTDVLNGIAYIPERDRFLITGKLWPYMFEVEFRPRAR